MEKMKRILFEELDYQIQGADIYNTKTSKWLIFTDSKKWVLEYTNSNTLWYNYTFFNNTLIFFGMDCADADSKDMIKEWFESRFLEKNIAHVAAGTSYIPYSIVENVVQNGVKHTYKKKITRLNEVEDTIQNGVKLTLDLYNRREFEVEDTVQNGVKLTELYKGVRPSAVEDTIKNGVKTMMSGSEWYHKDEVEEIIQKGVKETIGTLRRTKLGVDDIIKNGVKDTGARHLRINRKVDDAIENGVKEVKHRLIESYEQKDHQVTTLEISQNIKNAIENGVKE